MNSKVIFVSLIFLFVGLYAEAQCAMCRAVLESGESQEIAKGVNAGIKYLMLIYNSQFLEKYR